MRKKYVWRDGRMQEMGEGDAPAPRIHVIQDSMDATWHPCTGKIMDSKSEFRKVTKAHGGVEIGNENPYIKPKKPNLPPVIETIREAMAKHGVH